MIISKTRNSKRTKKNKTNKFNVFTLPRIEIEVEKKKNIYLVCKRVHLK